MRRFLRPLRSQPPGARWGRRRIPSLAVLLIVVVVLLVFNLSNWRYLRWLKDTMRDSLIERLASVASTTGLTLGESALTEVLINASERGIGSELDALDAFAASDEHQSLQEKLLNIQRANRLSRVALITPSGTIIADSSGRRQPGEAYDFLELDQEEMRRAGEGGPTATQLYRIDNIPYLRLYAALRREERVLALVQVSVSPEYQDRVDRMQQLVMRQWAISSLLLLLLGLSLWRLFRYLVRVEETAMQGARIDAMGALAGSVAHELRNPLQIIRALSEEIASDFPTGSGPAQNAADIISEVDRLKEMVTNFLSLSRPPGEGTQEQLDAVAEIERVLGLLRKGKHPAHLAFVTDLPATPVYVRADEHALRQVLLNLLLNACEAVEGQQRESPHERGEIHVSLRERRGWAEIRIADNGPGLDSRTAARAFEPFFSTKSMGTGLGLAISRSIIENLGGRISLTSTPGRGAEVLVALPAAPPFTRG